MYVVLWSELQKTTTLWDRRTTPFHFFAKTPNHKSNLFTKTIDHTCAARASPTSRQSDECEPGEQRLQPHARWLPVPDDASASGRRSRSTTQRMMLIGAACT